MNKESAVKLSPRALIYFVLGTVALVSFIVFVVLPMNRTRHDQQGIVVDLQTKLKRQEILLPLYTDLLHKLSENEERLLPFPEENTIALGRTGDFLTGFKSIAQKCDMELDLLTPDFQGMGEKDGLLSINAVMRGNFKNLRSLLVELGKIPELRHVEEVKIKSLSGVKEFDITFWLSVETRNS